LPGASNIAGTWLSVQRSTRSITGPGIKQD